MAPIASKGDVINSLRLTEMFPLLRQSVAESLFIKVIYTLQMTLQAENMIAHRDELLSRPKRTWFVTEKEKKLVAKEAKVIFCCIIVFHPVLMKLFIWFKLFFHNISDRAEIICFLSAITPLDGYYQII